MTATDMPLELVRVYLSIAVVPSEPKPDLTILGVAAWAGVAITPAPSMRSSAHNLRMEPSPFGSAQCERSHGGLSSRRRSGARAHDQLRGDLQVRRRTGFRGLDRVQQQQQPAPPHLVEIL